MDRLRVFLVDDHAVVREGMKALINAELGMEVVGEAGDGQTAWQRACELRPDVVVMDVSMPTLSGAQATERLKQECPHVKVLALTIHEDRSYLRALLAAGASGYVLKRAAAEELIRGIRTVAAGGIYLDPRVADKLVSNFVRHSPVAATVREGDLSDREREVLRMIAQGYSSKEIAARVTLSVKTVDTYKARAMEKLGLDSRVDLVRYAVQQGWLQDS
jgi:DNA-binding NarL/FixJ family response regulator